MQFRLQPTLREPLHRAQFAIFIFQFTIVPRARNTAKLLESFILRISAFDLRILNFPYPSSLRILTPMRILFTAADTKIPSFIFHGLNHGSFAVPHSPDDAEGLARPRTT